MSEYPQKINCQFLDLDCEEDFSKEEIHKNFSILLNRIINTKSNSTTRLITIEGAQGAGKSKVINYLKNKQNDCVEYNLLERHLDPVRRSFLLTLLNHLKNKQGKKSCGIGEFLSKIINKCGEKPPKIDELEAKINGFYTEKNTRKFSIDIAVTSVISFLGVFLLKIEWLYLSLGIVVFLFILRFAKISFSYNKEIIMKNPDNTSFEFKKYYMEILNLLCNSDVEKLVVIIENLDRISTEEQNNFLSNLQLFLIKIENVSISIDYVITYSAQNALNEKNTLGLSLLTKFSHVPLRLPEVISANNFILFQQLFKKAFPKDEKHTTDSYVVFMRLNKDSFFNPTPRDIKNYINKMVSFAEFYNQNINFFNFIQRKDLFKYIAFSAKFSHENMSLNDVANGVLRSAVVNVFGVLEDYFFNNFISLVFFCHPDDVWYYLKNEITLPVIKSKNQSEFDGFIKLDWAINDIFSIIQDLSAVELMNLSFLIKNSCQEVKVFGRVIEKMREIFSEKIKIIGSVVLDDLDCFLSLIRDNVAQDDFNFMIGKIKVRLSLIDERVIHSLQAADILKKYTPPDESIIVNLGKGISLPPAHELVKVIEDLKYLKYPGNYGDSFKDLIFTFASREIMYEEQERKKTLNFLLINDKYSLYKNICKLYETKKLHIEGPGFLESCIYEDFANLKILLKIKNDELDLKIINYLNNYVKTEGLRRDALKIFILLAINIERDCFESSFFSIIELDRIINSTVNEGNLYKSFSQSDWIDFFNRYPELTELKKCYSLFF